MLKLPSLGEMDHAVGVKIYLCCSPVDMRRGFDTLAAMAREHLGGDPMSGNLFLFVGRDKDRIKILYWDKDGFALWYKRLEQGTFRLPAAKDKSASIELKASELAMLLAGIDLTSIKHRKRFVYPESQKS